MRLPWIARLSLLGAFLALCTVTAKAQDNARVVRLSRTEGQVFVSHPGTDTWDEAPANLPLQEGDALATQAGMAEIEFENGATAYLADNSVLHFAQLGFTGDGGRVTQLSLTQGAGSFYANPTAQDFFRVITSTFEVAIEQRAEVRVDAFRDGASLEVLVGEVGVSTTKGSTTFEKGQSVAIHQDDLQNPQVARLPDQDAFDQWVTQEGETIRSGSKNTLNYVSSPNYYGLSDLSIYGSWVYLTGFGNCWRPFSAGFSWAPYMNGMWTRDARLGWIWVSSEPWGWMPYHFGNWLLSPILGWVWVPGGPAGLRQWEGARVNWVRTGSQVGWVAKSPNDRAGEPANLEHGLVTTAGISQPNRDGSKHAVAEKNPQAVVVLKEPPADFVAHPSQSALQWGLASTARSNPRTSEGNGNVVIERGTHTFINGNPGASAQAAPGTLSQQSGNLQGRSALTSIGPTAESNARTESRRVTIPPPASMDSQIRRVNAPPAGPAPVSRMLPNGVNSRTSTTPEPQSVRPGINPPPLQAAPPRQVNPPSQPARNSTPQPAAPPPAAGPQTNTVARPAAPAPAAPARPASGAGTQPR